MPVEIVLLYSMSIPSRRGRPDLSELGCNELVRSGSYMKPVDPLLHPPIVVHTVHK